MHHLETLCLILFQFWWGNPGTFNIDNNVLENFDEFVKTACKWVKIKTLPWVRGYKYSGDDEDDFGDQTVPLGELATGII